MASIKGNSFSSYLLWFPPKFNSFDTVFMGNILVTVPLVPVSNRSLQGFFQIWKKPYEIDPISAKIGEGKFLIKEQGKNEDFIDSSWRPGLCQ